MKPQFVPSVFWGTVSLVLAMAGTAVAAPVGPVYPAPGGNSFSSSGGSAGQSGGVTFSYSGFDTNAFTNLYWGPWDTNLPQAALDGSLDPATGFSVSGTTATWSGTTSYTDPDPTFPDYSNSSTPWELRIDITGLGANPWVLASSLGLASAVGYVVDNSAGSDFTANLQFLADLGGGGGFVALNTIQNGCCGKTLSSFQGGFYSTPVPEPSTLLLSGLGLAGVFGYIRRRQSAKQV